MEPPRRFRSRVQDSATLTRFRPRPPPTAARFLSPPAINTAGQPAPPVPYTSLTLVAYSPATYRPLLVRAIFYRSPTSTLTTITTPTCATTRAQTRQSASPTLSPLSRTE